MHAIKTPFAATILILSFAAQALSGPLEDGRAAAERGDHATAFRLFRPLAVAGNAIAQVEVGVMYTLGWGVSKDTVEGVKWYRLAAAQGNASGQDGLGFAYYFGQGAPQDYREAAKWLRLAAEQGLANAQNKIGLMYESGEGVPQDYVLAHLWFNLAAAQDFPAASNRERVATRMSASQIAEAQKLAREWKPKK